MNNDNTEFEKCQDIILDDELIKKFTPKRLASELLADSYSRIGYDSKSFRVSECGTWLEFRRPLRTVPEPFSAASETVGNGSEGWKLHSANFCRDRLCPMCSWRRSYKVYAQVSQIMDVIAGDYVFLFLTLTVPNCSSCELIDTIDLMQNAFFKLMHYKRVKTAVKGFFRALEVTRHNEFDSLYGTFHPHFHCILAVDKSDYFRRDYINRDEWLKLWQKATGNYNITQVDIRRCKSKDQIQEGEDAVKALGSAVAEVSKYSVKSVDYLFPDNLDVTDDVVLTLSSALHRRRLCAFGGCFEDVRKRLLLDDIENGDLVHIDGSELRPDVAYMIRRYGWSCGSYKLLEESRDVNVNIDCDEEEC